jgi:predicted nucleic acid-binding protein
VIAYFDTSSIVPLLIEEPGSEIAGRLWDEADRLVSIRLVMAEGRAALVQAARGGSLDQGHLRQAVTDLQSLYSQLDLVEVTDELVGRAGSLAEAQALRGYEALHLAAADLVKDPELVFVSGDAGLCRAAEDMGLQIASTAS